MSVSMYWYKPPTEQRELGSVGCPLKNILARRYGNHDGSCCENFTLGPGDLLFMEGLTAAGIEGAEQMFRDLEKYGILEVELR